MIHTEADPDSLLYENADTLDGPLTHTGRRGIPIYGSPSMEQSAVELAEEMQKAIHSGNERIAMEVARLLANLRLSVAASLESNSNDKAVEQEISIRMHVCNKDLASNENYITMKLRPTITIGTLKLVVYQKHGYLPELQKWIVGRRLARDGDTLAECGVNFNGAVMFLYLITPKDSQHSQGLRIRGSMGGSSSLEDMSQLQPSGQHELMPVLPSIALMNASVFTPPASILTPTGGYSIQPQTVHAVPVSSSSSNPEKVGWACPQCTYINLPNRPGCEMCATDRPATYTVPSDYAPTDHEMEMIRREREFPVLAEEDYDDVDAVVEDHSP